MADLSELPAIEQEKESGTPAEAAEEQKKGRGPLLDKPPEEAAKLADTLWSLDDKMLRRLSVQWEANKMRRKGIRDVHVVKDSDDAQGWRLYLPLVNASTSPVPNRTDESGRRVIATLLVDEPKPDVIPATDTAEDVDAAENSTRVLETESGPTGLNMRGVMEGALDLAYTFASGFTLTWTDMYGGGTSPRQVRCHPQATTVDEAETGPPDAQPSSDYILKYVMPDGALSDSSAGAQREWLPKVRKELLNSNHVRFLPRNTVRGIEDAQGAIITRSLTFGELKARYEDVATMSPGDQWTIVNWRPKRFKDLLPDGTEHIRSSGEAVGESESPPDDRLCFLRTIYYLPHQTYPEGCEACFAGGKFRLSAGGWMLSYQDANGQEHEEMRDIPLAQYRWMPDYQSGNPYGIAGAEVVGPVDEIRGFITSGVLEAVFKALNPNVAFPLGTTIQPEEWGRRDGTPVLYNAAAGMPWTEPPPVLPNWTMEMMQVSDAWVDNASGLSETAKGVNSPNIRSDAQAQTVIEQALVALASTRHSIEDGYERDCRITLQEFKQHFKAPQMIRYLSEDGAYKYTEWKASDLYSAKDVRVRKGTFTMMGPTARNQYIDQLVQMGSLPLDEAVRLKRSALDWLTGQEDDHHYQRIKRQISAWKQGPKTSQGVPPQQSVDPQTGQPITIDPATQEAAALFAPLPVDELPQVAQVRHKELAAVMATARFASYPDGWKQGLIQAYEQARKAAGIATIAEQQQAQQQAVQQQQQAQQQQVEAQQQVDQQKLQAEQARTSMELDKAQRMDQIAQVKHEREMQKMAMQPMVAKTNSQPA